MRQKFIFFVGVFVMVVLLLFFSRSPKYYVQMIRNGYEGKVIKIYDAKATHWLIQTKTGEILDEVMLSGQVREFVSVGDTIKKIPDQNYCIVYKNGQERKILYTDVPEIVRNDFRWPEDLKAE